MKRILVSALKHPSWLQGEKKKKKQQKQGCRNLSLHHQMWKIFGTFLVDFVRYLTFWNHTIQIQILTRKVCWLFCVVYMPLKFGSVKGIQLDVPLMRSLFISHDFFATARKIINPDCSIQSGRFLVSLNFNFKSMPSPRVQPRVRGRSAGSFFEQRLAIEPNVKAGMENLETLFVI